MTPVPLPLADFLGDVYANLVAGLIATMLLAFAGRWAWPRIKPVLQARWDLWKLRRNAEQLGMEIELSFAYHTHLRDVMQSFQRALDDPSDVRSRIRRDILEPVRAIIPTGPSEQIKVVWFRPTDDRTQLHMYEQVGHTEAGQQNMRLPIGSGVAGRSFVNKEPISVKDCLGDESFQQVEKSKAYGSLVCVPILKDTEATGVLSVLCTAKNAFWVTDVRYFEALAAAIGALEVLESSPEPSPLNQTS